MSFFDRKICILIGASSGIGRVTAKMLAAQGAVVVLVSRSQKSLDIVPSEIKNAGGKAESSVGDASIYADMERVAAYVARQYGKIDSWIHNAGSTEFSYFRDMEPLEIEQLVKVNLTGNLFGARAALPYLKRNPGSSLIHVTTVEAIRGTPYMSVYSAAKSGVNAFLEVLRMELRHEKINVHVGEVMPAGTVTPFFRNALTRLGILPTTMGKVYDPEVVAAAILRSVSHRKERIIVGWGGKLMFFFQKICPPLVAWGMEEMTFKGQKTNIPRLPTDPHTLFAPQPSQAAERVSVGKEKNT